MQVGRQYALKRVKAYSTQSSHKLLNFISGNVVCFLPVVWFLTKCRYTLSMFRLKFLIRTLDGEQHSYNEKVCVCGSGVCVWGGGGGGGLGGGGNYLPRDPLSKCSILPRMSFTPVLSYK